MKRILAFCFFPAFVPPSNGGQSRLFNFYRSLSRWHQITLLTSTHVGVEEEVIYHGLNFVERRIPKDEYFVREYSALDQFSGGGDLSGPAIAASSKWPTRLHRAYLENYKQADVIIHDFPFMIDYDLFCGTDSKPRLYNAHNCEAMLYGQLHAGKQCKPITDLVRSVERRMLDAVDLVLYCNDGDLAAFREMAPDTDFEALYVPNGMTPAADIASLTSLENQLFHAAFMGSGHPPNVHAAKFIAHTLAPKNPEITFDIIGSCLPEGDYAMNLRRHGVVDDETKARLLRGAHLALNPMAAGSGSNVKVLEYFAYALPVLSTTFGMRGIHAEIDKEYLEASLEQFDQVLKQVSHDPVVLSSVGEAGRALALEKYTWDAIVRPVAERLLELGIFNEGDQKRIVLALNDYDSFAGIGGGGTRTRGLYKAVRNWSAVVFVSFSSDGTLTRRDYCDGIIVINVPKSAEHAFQLDRVNAQFHVSADDIVASFHSTANPWLNVIYSVLRESARCIVSEHCYMAGLPLAWGDRFVYSSQNNETELKKRLLKWHPLKDELLDQVVSLERLVVERSAATIAVSLEDAASLVQNKRTAGPVIVVRNGASIPIYGIEVDKEKVELRERIGTRAAVFLGSAHMPNIEAVQFITEFLAPRCPDVQFHLLGSACTAVSKVPPNVQLWGVVDDVTKSAVMQSCAVALNPMNSGSGSNVKLADYLGNGLFVITTEFGQRGYPESIRDHISVVPLEQFAEALQTALDEPVHFSQEMKACRFSLFKREMAMLGLASRFVETLQGLEKKRKRVLYVAYRYVMPALGGAEANIEKFVAALGFSGEFDVDVVAPEVSGIHNHLRFSETYSFDRNLGAPVDIPNVRFARFPVEVPDQATVDGLLRRAWSVQPLFEQALDRVLRECYEDTGLTWGWGYPEGAKHNAIRWAFSECGLYLREAGNVNLEGYAPTPIVLTVNSGEQIIGGPWSLHGHFTQSFQAGAGEFVLATSVSQQHADPRPLAMQVSRIAINERDLDLSAPTLPLKCLTQLPAERQFHVLDQAAQGSRMALDVRLTDSRGPWSANLERFIIDHVADYDLVVTHNNVFRPAVVAIEEAKKRGIPSILIPHAHLDDDFYHFPDWLESARNASLVLAVPKAACSFLVEKGCNVRYLSAGCDATEEFTPADLKEFQIVYSSSKPFVLVLGRKAGAKGYGQIIDAVEQLNREGVDLQVVLIGPDDDGIPVSSPSAVYLGRQPRGVVRGALMSCLALCNMSVSESFGIVLLEAWMAGKPVIANKNCAAFHDMAEDGVNALLVDESGLPAAIRTIVMEPELRQRFAVHGAKLVSKFAWGEVCDQFVDVCHHMVSSD